MTIRTAIFTAAAIFLLSCCTLSAQSSHTSSGDKPQLVPGLDTSSIDTTADPCVDFFQYACGNFSKLHPIPPDRSGYGSGAIIFDYTETVLHTMLDKAASGGSSRTANEQKIGDYYASCTDTDAIEKKGLKPLRPDLDRIAALKSKDELAPLLGHFQMINVNAFFNFSEQQDFKDARKQIAVVDQGGLGLPERDYYFRTGDVPEKTRSQYVQHVANMLKLMGESESQAAGDAQKIMDLETALAKVSMDVTSRRDPRSVYHMMPVTDFAALAPSISWDRFFVATGVPAITELNVTTQDFFKGLDSLIASTDLATIKTYLRWQLVNSTNATVLPKALRRGIV